MDTFDYKKTPFADTGLSIEQRLDWLVSHLTLEEKFTLLSSFSAPVERLGIPGLGFGGEAAHGVEARNDQNGIGDPDFTTSFPQPIGMSSSWDEDLIQKAGEVTGTEARVVYHRHPRFGLSRWAPTIDLERDPRWGRNEEGYGEDPVQVGAMSAAYIRGMQGDHPHYLRIAATLKHFYANNVEFGRGWKNSSIDPRNKYELYLEPFRRAIEDGGVEGIMTAYNRINGTQGILNDDVQKILKDKYGLTHAVSDGSAMALVVSLSHNNGLDAETIAKAIKAGVDGMSDNPHLSHEAAKEAYELGLISEAEIDRAIRNTFKTRIKLGIYDSDNMNPYDRVGEEDLCSENNNEVCLKLSEESIVLLKNNGILPLDKESVKNKVALMGTVCDEWYEDWYGGRSPFTTTLKEGLEKVIPDTAITAHDGNNRVNLKCGEKYLFVNEAGKVVVSDKPTTFIMNNWGEGAYTFRDVNTQKYLTTHISDDPKAYPAGVSGAVFADAKEIFSWFALETFHMEEVEGGKVILQNRFADPLCMDKNGYVYSAKDMAKSRMGQTILMGADPGLDKSCGESGLEFEDGADVFNPMHIEIEVLEDGIADCVKAAANSEIVIMALGHNPMINAKEETDRSTIEFIPYQQKLFDAVYEVNKNIVVVLFSDYPFAINEINDKAAAVIWSATGSQNMGIAMAKALVGDCSVAGRLTQTWYKSDADLPNINDYDIIRGKRTYRYFEGEALYPFGYGLNYSRFEYSNLRATVESDCRIHIELTVTNAGNTTSDEVVQIYAKAPASRVPKPLKQLLAFERIHDIAPGESADLIFDINTDELRFYDVTRECLIVEEGSYTIFAGSNSEDFAVSAEIFVKGIKTGKRDLSSKIKADHYDEQRNSQIVEGCFGYKALAPASAYQLDDNNEDHTPAGDYEAIYRDCIIPSGTDTIRIHAFATTDAKLSVYVDDAEIGSWQGNTKDYEARPIRVRDMLPRALKDISRVKNSWEPIWADIRIPVRADDIANKECTVKICCEGNILFDWFQCVYKS